MVSHCKPAPNHTQRTVIAVSIKAHLLEEDLVLGHAEVDGEEARGEGGAEGVAVHQGNLSAHGLVLGGQGGSRGSCDIIT